MAAKRTAPIAGAAKRAKLEASVVSGQNRGMVQGVSRALEASSLPEDCRRMLQAACPLALGVASDARHPMQELAVELIGSALAGTQDALAKTLGAREAFAKEVLDSRTAVSQKLQDEEDFFEVKEAKAAQRAEDLAAAKAQRVARAATLAELRQTQKTGDAAAKALTVQRQKIAEALEDLDAIQSRDLGEEQQQRSASILEAAARLPLEDTLHTALPLSCGKPRAERSSFDDMVLAELRKVLDDEATRLDRGLAAEAAGLAERARLVAEAEDRSQESARSEEACRTAAEAAERDKAAQAIVVDAARKAVADFDADAASTVQACDGARLELENFKTYSMECFTLLRDRQGKAIVQAAGA